MVIMPCIRLLMRWSQVVQYITNAWARCNWANLVPGAAIGLDSWAKREHATEKSDLNAKRTQLFAQNTNKVQPKLPHETKNHQLVWGDGLSALCLGTSILSLAKAQSWSRDHPRSLSARELQGGNAAAGLNKCHSATELLIWEMPVLCVSLFDPAGLLWMGLQIEACASAIGNFSRRGGWG